MNAKGSAEKTKTSPSKPAYMVAIGASAGGLEAIESFFSAMPADSGLAFIVIQHLSPDYKSLMVELLSKRTPMKVQRAENGTLVRASCVYLIPPKHNLTIFHGKLVLTEQKSTHGLNLPIDIFFKSLALDQGDRAVGIILSGTGSDGVRGIRAIKEAGGMIMVQDDESARFDGMPRAAISTGFADCILAPEDMPEKLLAYSKHPYISMKDYPTQLLTDEDGLSRLFGLIRDKHKIDFSHYKMSTVTRRIERRMSVNQIKALRDYVRYLERNTREVSNLYRELLIGVTNFFRDPEAYTLLEKKWLPELLKNRSGQDVRFWVAGCSTGEEAYSLAILCLEYMERTDTRINIKIFATDVDNQAILKAGNGIYPESIAADIPAELRTRYFQSRDNNLQITRSIREMVVFAQHNLVKDPPFTNIDLVSCRNLLIYLQPVLQHKVLELFNFALNPHGILFLGSSETTGELAPYFEPLNHKWKIYRSKGVSRSLDVHHMVPGVAKINRPADTGSSYQQNIRQVHQEERVLNRFLNAVEGQYLPLTVIVNEQLEMLHIIGDSSSFFKLPSGKMERRITKLAVRDLEIPLATGLQKLFQKQTEIKYSRIPIRQNGNEILLRLRMLPIEGRKNQELLAAVFFETEKPAKTQGKKAVAYDVGKESQQRISDLEQELQFTKENLQATIEELETSNEELQATNEELLASNEELQSTNEELQSVNEELHTVNAEHQAKIMELTELNNDMENLLASTKIATIYLDENLEIRKFTPDFSDIFKLNNSDIGRTLDDIGDHILPKELLDAIDTVESISRPVETDMFIKDKSYLVRILPYEIGPTSYSGVICTLIDITQLKQVRKSLGRSEAWLEEVTALARVGGWEIDLETMETYWTDQVYKIHELPLDFDHNVEKGIQFYSDEDQPVIEAAVAKLLKTGEGFSLDLDFMTAKKNKRRVQVIGKADKVNDKISRVYGTIQDISEIARVRQDLEDSRAEVDKLSQTITKDKPSKKTSGKKPSNEK